MESDEYIDIAVIGAGLSGLCVATLAHQAGKSVHVLEAYEQTGGRIRSVADTAEQQWLGDLGPTWVWPKYQPVVRRWLNQLGLSTFEQYEYGAGLVDQGPEIRVQQHPMPAQDGIRRLDRGPQALITSLQALLPAASLTTGVPVTRVSDRGDHIELDYGQPGHQQQLRCKQLVCTAPARVAREKIEWNPSLPGPLSDAMRDTPTWMAQQAKIVVRYQRPFWRAAGLSGRIFSRVGPIGEAHDHCGPDESPAALFGFLNWPHMLRMQRAGEMEDAIRSQLRRCFGPESPAPDSIHLQDWALEAYVATDLDITEAPTHPDRRPDVMRQPWGNSKFWLAGAETATISPGLIEGALASAGSVAQAMLGP